MAGSTFSRIKTWIAGETLTASDLNGEFDNILDNLDPDGIDDASANLAAMQATRDPGGGSLATDLTGEHQAERFQINGIIGKDDWYDAPDTSLFLQFNKGADIASATALVLGTDGNYFDVTGTITITSIGTRREGDAVRLHFDEVLQLTHHATDLILPGGANITTIAGDEAVFIEYATGDWRLANYEPYLSANTTGTGDKVRATSPTIVTPTIASLANMNHDHTDSANGGSLGVLGAASATDLTLTGTAASPPDANTLTKENIVKAWAHITYSGGTPTLADNFNVSGIVDTASGRIVIQWNTDFANATYAPQGTAQAPSGGIQSAIVSLDNTVAGPLTTSDCDFMIENDAGTAIDPDILSIIAIGDQ